MSVEIKVPMLGESVAEATVAQWFKAAGETVAADEPLVELETDKVTVEVPAPAGGTLTEIRAAEGAAVEPDAVLGIIDDSAAAKPAARPAVAKAEAPPAPPPAAELPLSPAVRKLVAEHGLDPAAIDATGKDGRLTKGDVLKAIETRAEPAAEPAPPPTPEPAPRPTPPPAAPAAPAAPGPDAGREERVPMTRLRKRIAERLKEAQNTAAILTTFNEVDMSRVIALRKDYRDAFEKKHGVRLGFMSFFVTAAVVALRDLPAVNAEIDGDDIVYKNYYHIGVAVSAPQGLVVPVVRDADRLGFADIEKAIAELVGKARDGRLGLGDLTGGTFTITNGGIFGSLLSTPILNPPQAAILGMHKIQERPVAIEGAVEVRPMMNLALSYDHRIVDGRESVTFLVRIKECIEDPERLLLDV